MFHDNDSQLGVNLDYQLNKKEVAFMKNKTFFIRYYTIKFDLSLDILQHHILHYTIALIKSFNFPKLHLTNKQTSYQIFNINRMISCCYYSKFKSDVLKVTYTVLTKILKYVETAIPT